MSARASSGSAACTRASVFVHSAPAAPPPFPVEVHAGHHSPPYQRAERISSLLSAAALQPPPAGHAPARDELGCGGQRSHVARTCMGPGAGYPSRGVGGRPGLAAFHCSRASPTAAFASFACRMCNLSIGAPGRCQVLFDHVDRLAGRAVARALDAAVRCIVRVHHEKRRASTTASRFFIDLYMDILSLQMGDECITVS